METRRKLLPEQFNRITKPLVTENDLVEAPAQTCVQCAGLRFLDGILCDMCGGEGRIIVERNAPYPKLTLLKSAVITIIAFALLAYAKHWAPFF